MIFGGVRHGPAVRAGDPTGSVLIKALRGEMTPQMPLGKPALAEADVAGVATDSQDRVYVFNRGEHPVMVFQADGTFLSSWGEGEFVRAHGIW